MNQSQATLPTPVGVYAFALPYPGQHAGPDLFDFRSQELLYRPGKSGCFLSKRITLYRRASAAQASGCCSTKDNNPEAI